MVSAAKRTKFLLAAVHLARQWLAARGYSWPLHFDPVTMISDADHTDAERMKKRTPADLKHAIGPIGDSELAETEHPPESRLRPAANPKIDEAITAAHDEAAAAGKKPPNVKEIVAPVQAILRAQGYEASGRHIQKLAEADQHKIRRRKAGVTVASEKRRQQR